MLRSSYLISGALHLTALLSLFVLAQLPGQPQKVMRRFQPVRLVAPAGTPGPRAKVAPKIETPAPKVKSKVTEEAKPAVKSTSQFAAPTSPSEPRSKQIGSGGGGGSGPRLEGINFPYPYYLSNIQVKILSNFKPTVGSRQAQELKAIVFFTVDKNGKILEVKLEEKSGHFLFDQEAQRAVLRSSPLPPLPPAFGSDRLGVHFEFLGLP